MANWNLVFFFFCTWTTGWSKTVRSVFFDAPVAFEGNTSYTTLTSLSRWGRSYSVKVNVSLQLCCTDVHPLTCLQACSLQLNSQSLNFSYDAQLLRLLFYILKSNEKEKSLQKNNTIPSQINSNELPEICVMVRNYSARGVLKRVQLRNKLKNVPRNLSMEKIKDIIFICFHRLIKYRPRIQVWCSKSQAQISQIVWRHHNHLSINYYLIALNFFMASRWPSFNLNISIQVINKQYCSLNIVLSHIIYYLMAYGYYLVVSINYLVYLIQFIN